jgi:hypothetical protein
VRFVATAVEDVGEGVRPTVSDVEVVRRGGGDIVSASSSGQNQRELSHQAEKKLTMRRKTDGQRGEQTARSKMKLLGHTSIYHATQSKGPGKSGLRYGTLFVRGILITVTSLSIHLSSLFCLTKVKHHLEAQS